MLFRMQTGLLPALAVLLTPHNGDRAAIDTVFFMVYMVC